MKKLKLRLLFKAVFILIISGVVFSNAKILNAQAREGYVVKGKVIDQVSGIPLQGASVFAQNTTLGAATDAEGKFAIWLPEGGYDLAITYTGYESESRRISRSSSSEEIVFTLAPKEKSLEVVSVTISNEVKNGWEKYGEFFKENFIGQSAFSRQCVVENPNALHFYFSKKRNR
ncbi:MAG: carboxypeptidase-like regulatory domain-containing protein, partial [Ginsengibacter sp.]